MAVLCDHLGNPIDKSRLKGEEAAPTISGVRQVLSGHPAQNLTPRKLARLLLAAEQGDATAYLELAEEMEEKDLHYRSVISTRKLQVSGLPITVEAASDDAEDVKAADLVRDFLRESVLDDALKDTLDAIGKGYSVCEIMWNTEGSAWYPGEILWRDPRWFSFDPDDGTTLRLRGDNGQLEPLAPAKYIVHTHKSKSGLPIRGGLARPVAWYYLFKNFDIKSWMEFLQVFGFPLRLGLYGPEATQEERQTLLRAVRNITKDAAAIIPQGMEIKFEGTDVRGNVTVFEGMAEYIDKQVSKLVLGQTGTTDVGQHVGTADAHEKVREDICTDDAKQLAATLNRDLVRPLIVLNLGPRKHYPKLVIAAEESEDVTAWVDNVLKAAEHYEGEKGFAEASVLRDKLGVPEPAPGAEVIGRRTGAKEPEQPAPDAKNAPPEKEAAALESPGSQGADEIDLIIQEELGNWRPLLSPLVDPILALAEECDSYEEFRSRLPEAMRAQKPEAQGEALAVAMFEQRAKGELDG